MPILKQASENLVDIHGKEVLDITSCFLWWLGGYSYREMFPKKIKQQEYLMALMCNKINHNYKITNGSSSNVFGIPKEVNIYGWRREVEFEQK